MQKNGGPHPMTDPKAKPTAENVERARAWQGEGWRADMLAAEFSASDAIARRRAIMECARWFRDEGYGSFAEASEMMIRALLRAPTSDQPKDQESAVVAEEPASSAAANRSPNAGPDTRLSVTAGETASASPRPAPLSPEEQEKRKPLPVEALACAEQDRVHKETGRLVGSMPIVATSEKAEETKAAYAAKKREAMLIKAGEACEMYVQDTDGCLICDRDAHLDVPHDVECPLAPMDCSTPADGGGG